MKKNAKVVDGKKDILGFKGNWTTEEKHMDNCLDSRKKSDNKNQTHLGIFHLLVLV